MASETSANRYARAKEIFFAALELDPAQHADFIQERCGDDAKLRREVESLLAAREDARDFLKSPPLETVSHHKWLKNEVIGGYRLIRELGAGGMGVVFLAEKTDPEFRRQVALKFVKGDIHSKEILKRFHLERQILSRLEHPNVARLIDGGTSRDGLPYFVMEYVEGVPIIEYAESNYLSLAERLELFHQVCAAVSFAHKHAVIHRDLKPSNILVKNDGTVKLLDFGIAKLLSSDALRQTETLTTIRAMTPEYASPEQVKGETVTTVSDVYSLGVILYKLLTGARPYKTDSENLNEVVRAVCETEPAAPSAALRVTETDRQVSTNISASELKGDLDNIILKALRKEPERRYSSVEAFSEDLRRYLHGLPVSARHDTFIYRAGKFVRRNRVTVAFATLGILALLGGIVATVWQARRAEQQRARAERRFNEVRTLANSFMFELNDEILKGQTQARELVVKRAVEYLNRLANEAKDDDSLLRELAVAYLKIGDIQGKPYRPNLGDTDGALESYRKAILILESLHTSDPANHEIQRDLGIAYSSIGSLQLTRKAEREEAIRHFQKSRVLLEPLVAAEPTNIQYRRMLAELYKLIGDAAITGPDEKMAMHQNSLKLLEELLADDPTNTQVLTAVASGYQRIGTILKGGATWQKKPGDFHTALENFNKSLAIYKVLMAGEPNNSRHRRNAADIMAMSLPVQASLGDKAGVMEGYQTAMAIFEKLAAQDPKNAEARLDIAFTHQYMCQSLLELNSHDDALKSCRKAIEAGKSLLAMDPTNAEVSNMVYHSYMSMAEALKEEGDLAGEFKLYKQMLGVAEQWSDVEVQSDFGLEYIYHTSARIGNRYEELASDAKTSAKVRREHLQNACRWLQRSLNALRDLEKQDGPKQIYADRIKTMTKKIADCDAALGF